MTSLGLTLAENGQYDEGERAIRDAIALLSDTIGFITIMLIEIRMIQEMAITASLGVAIIILTDLILVPVLLSHVRLDQTYMAKMEERADHLDRLWALLSKAATPRNSTIIIAIAAVLFVAGALLLTLVDEAEGRRAALAFSDD